MMDSTYMDSDFSVFDMIADAESSLPDGKSIFDDDPPSSSTKNDETDTVEKEKKAPPKKVSKTEWMPSAEAMAEAGISTKPSGVIYSKDELKTEQSGPLKNIMDDDAITNSQESMDELDRVNANILRAKKALGVDKLNIPPIFNAEIITRANDPKGYQGFLAYMKNLLEEHPDFVISRTIENKPEVPMQQDNENNSNVNDTNTDDVPSATVVSGSDEPPVEIIIDKSNVSEVAFSQEDIDTIRKRRSVMINVQEERDMTYTIIDSDDSSPLDKILGAYTRKLGDFPLTLPASHYRCTMTGVSYPEFIDLSYSHQITGYDAEKKKWSIVFKHMKNPSIGDFKGWIDSSGNEHSAFEDFMRKTSYYDLPILIWGILCATLMEDEITSVNCDRESCKSTYEWIYHPKQLLDIEKFPEETLEEMKIAGSAQGIDEIEKVYKTSCLYQSRYCTLPDSRFVLVLKHPSAWHYVEDIINAVAKLRENANDLGISDVFAYASLEITDSVLIPSDDGHGYHKIKKLDNIAEVIKSLSSVDSAALNSLVDDIVSPYKPSFVMKDVICPKCKSKSDIKIDRVDSLLFIAADTLENVNVVLRRS